MCLVVKGVRGPEGGVREGLGVWKWVLGMGLGAGRLGARASGERMAFL